MKERNKKELEDLHKDKSLLGVDNTSQTNW